ncbi:hypothetical protein BDQ17DRAFT_1330656 [Cyathus striatus]|nr:hypothetical protein BDQ17DRAFT_1330656 [Cyathus striatus]
MYDSGPQNAVGTGLKLEKWYGVLATYSRAKDAFASDVCIDVLCYCISNIQVLSNQGVISLDPISLATNTQTNAEVWQAIMVSNIDEIGTGNFTHPILVLGGEVTIVAHTCTKWVWEVTDDYCYGWPSEDEMGEVNHEVLFKTGRYQIECMVICVAFSSSETGYDSKIEAVGIIKNMPN